jgi:hypothetical protein
MQAEMAEQAAQSAEALTVAKQAVDMLQEGFDQQSKEVRTDRSKAYLDMKRNMETMCLSHSQEVELTLIDQRAQYENEMASIRKEQDAFRNQAASLRNEERQRALEVN